jgi:ABC-2 type transport system ATP-binding protein
MQQFGLWEARAQHLGEYSKGMRQKVALIRAMLHTPRILFLDEPTSAMDPHSAKQVRDAIASLRHAGHTVVLCTHNLHEAEALADRIALIRRGELIALGTPAELKRAFLGAPLVEVHLARPLNAPWPSLDGHMHIVTETESSLQFRTERPEVSNPLLLNRLVAMGAEVVTMHPVSQSLEEVYLKLVEEQK